MEEQMENTSGMDDSLVPGQPLEEAGSSSSEGPVTQMPSMDFGTKKEYVPPRNPTDMSEADAEAMMLKMMEQEAATGTSDPVGHRETSPEVEKYSFQRLRDEGKPEAKNIEMLLDVTLPVSIELGRTTMRIEDVLNLGPGSVVELDKLAGEPVDLFVNDKLLAKGEVVVIDENFGVRITTMVSPQDRIKSLR